MTPLMDRTATLMPMDGNLASSTKFSLDQQAEHTWLISHDDSTPAAEGDRTRERERERDIALVKRMATGDATALAAFYDRYSSPMYSLALKIVGHDKDAEDVLQEAFVNIWNNAKNYNARLSAPFSWAVMILRYKAIDRLRSRQQHKRIIEGASAEQRPDMDVDDLSALEPELRERREMVRRALNRLSPEARQALELAFFTGMTHEEIAGALAQPVGTIKSRIRRALLQLRDYTEAARQT